LSLEEVPLIPYIIKDRKFVLSAFADAYDCFTPETREQLGKVA
jgi:hypothetical protein